MRTDESHPETEVTRGRLKLQAREQRYIESVNNQRGQSDRKLVTLFSYFLGIFDALLFSFGVNMLATSSPDKRGWIFVVFSIILSSLIAYIKIYILGDSN